MKVIAITGPESTGKTTLAGDLATAFATSYVPEYARHYLEQLDRPYFEKDLLSIAQGQLALHTSSIKTNAPIVFWDTDLSVIQIWSRYTYGRVHPWIRKKRRQQPIDLYVLTHYDIPYEEDPLREHPEKREELFHIYHKFLALQAIPFVIATGNRQTRCEAIKASIINNS